MLDTYYLYQEKLYRELHKWIIKNANGNFSDLFNFNTEKFKDKINIISVFMSGTEAGFYFPIALITLIIITVNVLG